MKNAKIQITVKVDDLPKEVTAKLQSVNMMQKSACKILEDVLSLIQTQNIIKAAETLNNFRDEIAYIDMVCSDCFSILTAYAKHKASELEPERLVLPNVNKDENKENGEG